MIGELDVLQPAATEQGWDTHTCLTLAVRFIVEEERLGDEFRAFLREQQDEENDGVPAEVLYDYGEEDEF